MKKDNLLIDNNLYFSKQMITNACATQAIINILLNCKEMNIGDTLKNL